MMWIVFIRVFVQTRPLREPAIVRVTGVVLVEPCLGKVAGIRVRLGEPAVVRVAPVVLSEPGVSRVALANQASAGSRVSELD